MNEEQIEAVCDLAWDAAMAARDGDVVTAERLLEKMEQQLRQAAIQLPECPQDIS